ncbi:MAG TPA: hypothetical protein VN692_13010 [Steroidobacteraceae bacterium]|nr:hypothetical protein [Steroidobacteraceae bacterium]
MSVAAGVALLGAVAGISWARRPAKPVPKRSATRLSKPAPPMKVPQIMTAGIWRTDGGFMSDIKLQNALAVAPIAVTATLYMSDGTPYALAPVVIPASGSADISINAALDAAPPWLSAHRSQFGSASYSYTWDSPGHVPAEMTMMDTARSLVFSEKFAAQLQPGPAPSPTPAISKLLAAARARKPPGAPPPGSDSSLLQALWWRHDPSDHGEFTVANVSGSDVFAQYRLTGSAGTAVRWRQFELPGHALEQVPMDDLIAELPAEERARGGLDIELVPALSTDASPTPMPVLMPWGGFMNERTGYSANLDFQMAPSAMAASMAAMGGSTAAPGHLVLGAAGIMVGAPMPGSGFPERTRFRPYALVRNLADADRTVSVSLSLADAPLAELKLPPFPVPAGATIELDLAQLLARLRGTTDAGRAPGQMLNWSLSYDGMPSDIEITTGSVDQSGSYVFAVVAQQEGASVGQLLPMWSTADGDDTMITLWNQDAAAQDLDLSFNSSDGSGQYLLPVHLEAGAATFVDLAQIESSGQLDPKGRPFPAGARSGSAMLMPAGIPEPGPNSRRVVPKTGFWTMHNIVLSAAVFNVRTATCCYVCSDCCGYSCPQVFIDPDIDIPIEDEFGANMTVEDVTGASNDCTGTASWTGDAGAEFEGIAGGEAQFTATALGETDVEGELFPVDVPFEGNPFDCPCGCPTGDLIAAAPVEVVTPVHIDSITPSAVLVGTSVDVEIDGSGFSSPASVSISGSGITASSVTVVSATEIDATFAIATTASNSVNVSVTANGVPSDNSVAFVPQYPRLRVFSDNAQDLSSGCTSQGLLGYSLRNITYDIVDQNGNTIQMQNGNGDLVGPNIAEVFNSISSNSCGNGTPPPTSCTAANVTQFTDHLFVGCNTVGGSCGYTLTNQWRTCPAGGSQAPIGTTAWTIHNNATTIVIGGISYSLPGGNQVPTGTIIAP